MIWPAPVLLRNDHMESKSIFLIMKKPALFQCVCFIHVIHVYKKEQADKKEKRKKKVKRIVFINSK